MVSPPGAVLCGFAALLLLAATPSSTHTVPDWLLGSWMPVKIFQDADGRYPSRGEEPQSWLAGQQLVVATDSLTLADDRCQSPSIAYHRGPWSTPLHQFGGGNLESLGVTKHDRTVDYIALACLRDLQKPHGKLTFNEDEDRGVPITWYLIVHSHAEIDLPFFGGSYVKFRKPAPGS